MSYEYMSGMERVPIDRQHPAVAPSEALTPCEQRQCPIDSSLQKLEFSYLDSERSRAREQAMRDQGCEYLCTPMGPIGSHATMHFCCPPGFETPGIPVVSQPGIVVQQEKKYFGFTTTELMLGALGFGALYFLVLKK